MASKLQVEDLTRGVKDVQNVKSSLEHKLNERRNKRKEAEKVLETVNCKFSQVKFLHSKLMENVKVAQHKVSCSQAQCDRMEEENKMKRQTLQKMEEQYKDSCDTRTEVIHNFEEELSKLSKFLIGAKELYSGAKLRETIAEANEKAIVAENQLLLVQEEEAAVSNNLKDLSSAQNKEVSIDEENIWNLINAEQKAALECIKDLNDEIAKVSQGVPTING